MNMNSVESSRGREAHGFKDILRRVVAVAFLGGVVLAASFLLLRGGGDPQTFPEVDGVRHLAMPGIPRDIGAGDAGRTMVATYYGHG